MDSSEDFNNESYPINFVKNALLMIFIDMVNLVIDTF